MEVPSLPPLPPHRPIARCYGALSDCTEREIDRGREIGGQGRVKEEERERKEKKSTEIKANRCLSRLALTGCFRMQKMHVNSSTSNRCMSEHRFVFIFINNFYFWNDILLFNAQLCCSRLIISASDTHTNTHTHTRSHLLMTLSRMRSTRLSLASLCSGVRQRSGSKSEVKRREDRPSVCVNITMLRYSIHGWTRLLHIEVVKGEKNNS